LKESVEELSESVSKANALTDKIETLLTEMNKHQEDLYTAVIENKEIRNEVLDKIKLLSVVSSQAKDGESDETIKKMN
jgi:hypothetical protein